MRDLKATWSSLMTKEGSIYVVKTLDIFKAMRAAGLSESQVLYCYYDEDEYDEDWGSPYGSSWRMLRQEWTWREYEEWNENEELKESWESDGTPWEFDLERLAKLARRPKGFASHIKILDEDGNDISGEYMRNDLEESEVREILFSSAKNIGKAGMLGVKLAGAQKMNEVAYDRIKPLLESHGLNADDPALKATILIGLPLILHPLATTLEKQVPHAQYIKGALEVSFTESVRVNSAGLIEFASDLFKDMYLADTSSKEKMRIEVNYDKYNNKKLKELAKSRGLRISGKKADELIEMLQEADAEASLLESVKE